MKTLIFALLLASVVSSVSAEWYQQKTYGDNYQDGYREGSTYNEGGIRSIAPIAPIPPIRRVGESDSDGYTRGLLDAVNKRQERKSGFNVWGD